MKTDDGHPSLGWMSLFIAAALFASSVAHAQVEVSRIDIGSAGSGKRMLLGDVTGDGRMDFVMMQGDQMADDRYIGHQVNCLTAFDFEGNQLWQVGNPANGESTGSDIPAQIYDLDGDGYNEVLACMDNDVVSRKFVVLDGRTGDVEATYDYPSTDAHDTIVIANFSGNARPMDVCSRIGTKTCGRWIGIGTCCSPTPGTSGTTPGRRTTTSTVKRSSWPDTTISRATERINGRWIKGDTPTASGWAMWTRTRTTVGRSPSAVTTSPSTGPAGS
jgi:hypothetical protein